ncbi:MAG: aldose 1-epimerase family protein, partial [Atopostipes sp.]|nr:aldose 1-epimerase family protein [Atopostipes sp.]
FIKLITLKNKELLVKINEKGAELSSVTDRKSGHEFIWQADEEYWGRHAPVLFPIIGRLKNDQYKYEGKTYNMSQHGFARDRLFELEETDSNSALFSLTYDKESLKNYPFKFKLYIRYILDKKSLTVDYEVINLSRSKGMYYSIGGHPAFNVSQDYDSEESLELKEISLEINPKENYKKIPISKEGYTQLDKTEKEKVYSKQLTHETFKDDALVYEISQGSEILLKDKVEKVEIQIHPNQMNFLGVWSPYPKKASFVCLEPWTGFADNEKASGKFTEKKEISFLEKEEKANHQYTITFIKETS